MIINKPTTCKKVDMDANDESIKKWHFLDSDETINKKIEEYLSGNNAVSQEA